MAKLSFADSLGSAALSVCLAVGAAGCGAAPAEKVLRSGQAVSAGDIYNFGTLAHPGACLDALAGGALQTERRYRNTRATKPGRSPTSSWPPRTELSISSTPRRTSVSTSRGAHRERDQDSALRLQRDGRADVHGARRGQRPHLIRHHEQQQVTRCPGGQSSQRHRRTALPVQSDQRADVESDGHRHRFRRGLGLLELGRLFERGLLGSRRRARHHLSAFVQREHGEPG